MLGSLLSRAKLTNKVVASLPKKKNWWSRRDSNSRPKRTPQTSTSVGLIYRQPEQALTRVA